MAGDEKAGWQTAIEKQWTEKRGRGGRKRGRGKIVGTFKVVGVANARDACLDSTLLNITWTNATQSCSRLNLALLNLNKLITAK